MEKIYVQNNGIWTTQLEIDNQKDNLILTTQDYSTALYSEKCPYTDCNARRVTVEFSDKSIHKDTKTHGMYLYDTHYNRPMPNKLNGDIRML